MAPLCFSYWSRISWGKRMILGGVIYKFPGQLGENLNLFSGTECFPYIKNVLQCESMWKHKFKRNNFYFMHLKRGYMTVKSIAEVVCSMRSGAQITAWAFYCPRKWLLRVRLSVLPYHWGCLFHQQMNHCKRCWHRHVALVCSVGLWSLDVRLVRLELPLCALRQQTPCLVSRSSRSAYATYTSYCHTEALASFFIRNS